MKLKLVSAVMCPYVQRAVILLREKNAAHEVTYIDLEAKPDWFLKISPRGKVPVLLADDVPLFESSAICEFLDETCPPPRLMPEDPVARARDRGLFQFAEDVFAPVYRRMNSPDREVYDRARDELDKALTRLDGELGGKSYLSLVAADGSRFGFADVAFTPAFTKIAILEELDSYRIPEGLTNLHAWSTRVLARESVQGSVRSDYRDVTLSTLKRKGALAVA